MRVSKLDSNRRCMKNATTAMNFTADRASRIAVIKPGAMGAYDTANSMIVTTVRANVPGPGPGLPFMQLFWTILDTQTVPKVQFPAFDTTYTDLVVSGTLPLDPSGLPWTRAAINLLTVDILCFANGGVTTFEWNATTVTVYGT